MDKLEFAYFRKKLGKTQREMSELLGTSLKAVHSYEQGWRRVPVHVERQVLFLAHMKQESMRKHGSCWDIKQCPQEHRDNCPAWEFHTGELCWFINGTFCDGRVQKDWKSKMRMCRKCEVFISQLPIRAAETS